MSFRLTYATMFNPPEEMHERFEKALARVRGRLGQTHPMFIDGKDVPAARRKSG
jgi:1-pyrroline-5-carboxylate dehydrogenase